MRFGIGMFLWTTDPTAEHLHRLGEMAGLGYDGVEIPIRSESEADFREIRLVLDDAGLSCTTMTNVGADKDPVHEDPAVRRRAVDEFRWGVDTAAMLGSDILCGPIQSAYGVFTGSGPTEAEIDRSAEVLRAVAEHAEGTGVRLAAEVLNRHESYFLNTLGAGAGLAARVDHPAFGILYDTHHAHGEEADVGAALRAHGHVIHHVQFSENHRGTLGQGQVDWASTIAALGEVGYDGWVVAEAFADDVPPLSSLAHVWRNTFESKDQYAHDALAFMRQAFGEG